MKTMQTLIDEHGLVPDASVFEQIEAELEIPVYSAVQFQGDLAFLPLPVVEIQVSPRMDAKWLPVPKAGVALLTGQGGHTHRLVADPGSARWTTDVVDGSGQALGVIDVKEPAYVQHEEHGALGLAPGQWVVRRQVEWADQQRQLVAD